MAASDNMGEQFRTIYHISDSETPPHLADHPHYAVEGSTTSEKRIGSNNVIFGTEEKGLHMGEHRPYAHKYRVPESAISPEIFNDDDTEDTDPPFAPIWQKRPQLWQQTPARRTDALNRGVVTRFVNMAEGVRTEGGTVRHTLSYIMPKPHMEKLGIVYEGVESAGAPSESFDKVERRVRKSYGKDAI